MYVVSAPVQRPAVPRRVSPSSTLDAFLTSHQPRAFLDELRLRLPARRRRHK